MSLEWSISDPAVQDISPIPKAIARPFATNHVELMVVASNQMFVDAIQASVATHAKTSAAQVTNTFFEKLHSVKHVLDGADALIITDESSNFLLATSKVPR